MSRGRVVSALCVAACAAAITPVASSSRGTRPFRAPQQAAQAIDVSGLWQTITWDIRYPFNVTECIRSGAGFSVQNPAPGTPWTLSLMQVGTTLSGTLQQSGPWSWCAPDPVAIENGSIEGDLLSFTVHSPSGSTIEFAGDVQADGNSIAVARSPVAPGAAASSPNNLGPFSPQPVGLLSHFVVQRVTAPGSNGCPNPYPAALPLSMARCEVADPQAPPFVTGTSEWVATDVIGFSPWTFDLTIGLHGGVTGTVSQNAMDAPTRLGPTAAGPFAIIGGQADARSLGFTVKSPDGNRLVRFSGVRHGTDAIDFQRWVEIMTRFPPGSNLHDLFWQANLRDAAGPAMDFAAWRVPSDGAVPAAAAVTEVRSDVQLESVDDRSAVVPASSRAGSAALDRPGFALIRYQVQPSFQGRLFVLALDAAGQPMRQFEVAATAGSHVAVWDLRPTGIALGVADNNATEQDLRVAETRATIVADAIRLAADVPNEAATAGLSATLSAMLSAPGVAGATQSGGQFVAPGNDTIALARADGGSLVILASRPCVVTAGK